MAANFSPLHGDVNGNVREVCHFIVVFSYDQMTEKSKKMQNASMSNCNTV
jgi:hypothetical protein